MTGISARTISRVLRRAGVPYLWQCDPLTGDLIRASKTTALRYEHPRPGDLVHVDVKKIGKIPDGGGWKANGRAASSTARDRTTRVGFDYIHSAVDDHSRLAYCEILPDEKAPACAGFIDRALTYFAAAGAPVRAIITDNHWSYAHSTQLRDLLAERGTEHWFIKAHCPWQNGKVERFNRTLATEWAYRQVYRSNDDRTRAFTTWLQHYNNERHHHAIGAAPITRLSPT